MTWDDYADAPALHLNVSRPPLPVSAPLSLKKHPEYRALGFCHAGQRERGEPRARDAERQVLQSPRGQGRLPWAWAWGFCKDVKTAGFLGDLCQCQDPKKPVSKPRIDCIDGCRFALVLPIIIGHFIRFGTSNKWLLKLLTQDFS